MSFYCDANDTGGQQLVLEEVLRLTGGGSGAAKHTIVRMSMVGLE